MSDETNRSLTMAYELIEAEKLSEARSTLEPLLSANKDDPNIWWLYVHAAEDPAAAKTALQNVLRLDPKYPGADQLAQQLEGVSGSKTDIDDLDFDAFDLDDADEDKSESSRRELLMRSLMAVLIVVILVVVVVVAFSPGDDEPDVEPTTGAQVAVTNTMWAVASVPTATEITPTPPEATILPTDTSDGSQSEFQEIIDALADFELYGEMIEVVETDQGMTLLALVCMNSDESLRTTMDDAMLAITGESATLVMDVDAFGVRLIDCDSEETFNTIIVTMTSAAEYLNGTLTEDDYRRRWMPAR